MTSLEGTWNELLQSSDWIHGLARDLVADGADDLAQDTMLRVARHRSAIRAFRPFVRKALDNRTRERARSDERRRTREAASAPQLPAPDTHEVVERFETQRIVVEAVSALDEPFRTTVLRHYFDGESLATIARTSDTSAGTVRWRLHRAHELLRESLEKRYGADSWKAALLPLALRARSAATSASPLLVAALWVVGIAATLSVSLWIFGVFAGDTVTPNTPELTAATSSNTPTTSATPVLEEEARTTRTTPRTSPEEASTVAQEPLTEQHATVRARLVDGLGAPIENATLSVVGARLRGGFAASNPLLHALPKGTSSTDGSVVLPLTASLELLEQVDQDARPAPGQPWTIVVEARSRTHVPEQRDVHIAHGDDLDLGDIELRSATTIEGRVVDARGNGIGGAEVRAVLPPFPFDWKELAASGDTPHASIETTTASWIGAGSFRLRGVPRGPVMIWASKDGHASAFAIADVTEDTLRVSDLVLPPLRTREPDTLTKRSLTVHVESPDGKPVRALVYHEWGESNSGTWTSDSDGKVEITWWDRGTRAATCNLGAIDVRGELGPVYVTAQDTSAGDVTLRLTEPRRFDVLVRSKGGLPLQGLKAMWMVTTGSFASLEAHAIEGNRCSLTTPAAPAKLIVEADGHAKALVELSDPASIPATMTVALSPLVGIRGRVLVGERPVAGATVEVLAASKSTVTVRGFLSRFDPETAVTTDADGRFVIGIEKAMQCVVQARLDGRAPATTELLNFEPTRGLEGIELRLGDPSAIAGTVLRSDRSPAARTVIALNDGYGHARTVITDMSGHYRFDDVAAGSYELCPTDQVLRDSGSYASMPTFGKRWFATNVDVAAGETKTVDLHLGSCRVRGRFARTDDDPRGFQVGLQALHDGRTLDSTIVGADGTFELSTFAPGHYELRVMSLGGPRGHVLRVRKIELREGTSDIVVPWSLTPFDGTAPSGYENRALWLRAENDGWKTCTRIRTDATGHFTTTMAPTGTVELVAGWIGHTETVTSYRIAGTR
ncbi:MAG: sigma-70 family RNA polymerase sigma factor [Planctomycetes bacterium]|nr:sigma-70 family RNA polymerase sigma factor [Planctomycetota bacterium]